MKARNVQFQLFRPHTGAQSRFVPLDEILRTSMKVRNTERIKDIWQHHYDRSVSQCSHMFWNGKCMTQKLGSLCDVGMRRRKYTVLSGSIFAVWDRIELQLRSQDIIKAPQVIRLKITDGSKIVGVLVPQECVSGIVEDLQGDSEEFEEQNYID